MLPTTFKIKNIETIVFCIESSILNAFFLEKWNLPSSIWEPIKYHHSPEKAENFQEECAIIHVADIIAHCLELGMSGEKRISPISDTAWNSLGMTADQLPQIVEEVEYQFNESLELFSGNLH